MIGSGTLLAQGTSVPNTGVYANTDGFAVAQVLYPSDNSQMSYAYGQIYTAGTWFQNQGGTVGSFGSGWSYAMNNNPNAMTIPIAANSYWQYYGGNAPDNQMDSVIQIWWFPLGGGADEETCRIVSEDEPDFQLADPPPIGPVAGNGSGGGDAGGQQE